jgi:hypothetical protein
MTINDPHTKASPVDGPTARHDISTVLAREPCAGCGAPLGADQRYCLSCGIPRSGTRLPFLDVLHAEAASAGIVEQGSSPASLLRVPALASEPSGSGPWGASGNGPGGISMRLRENTGLFALLGVLLLALLIGLLLGHWVGGGSKNVAALPAKQIVEIKGLPAVSAAPDATAPTSGAAAQSAAPTAPKSSGATPAATAPTAHATNPTVSTLASSTGKEHAKAVEQALSKGGGSLSTGGAPPPKETSKPGSSSKPIGAGSEVTSIE